MKHLLLILALLVSMVALPTAAAAQHGCKDNWSETTTNVTFNLYRSTTPGGEGSTPYLTNVGNPPYLDTGVVINNTYYYKVTAVCTAQSVPVCVPGLESPQSNEATCPFVTAGTPANNTSTPQ
jgi:fibronectin type 3 domain-containing protein